MQYYFRLSLGINSIKETRGQYTYRVIHFGEEALGYETTSSVQILSHQSLNVFNWYIGAYTKLL